MSILQTSLSISIPPHNLSSSRVSCAPNLLFLASKFSHLTIRTTTGKPPPIRMGGGPRTYPGGVSKWQWKRMQQKKAKQLLQAGLARERQIYEMRKRAELKAAVSELERPWDVVQKAPKLFSVSADEQVKVLADRFQKPGGFDMWSEKDGPQLFRPVDGVSSARFFPKGVVHSIKPYGGIGKGSDGAGKSALLGSISGPENGKGRNGYSKSGRFKDGSSIRGPIAAKNTSESVDRNGTGSDAKFSNKGKSRRFGVGNSNKLNGLASGGNSVDGEQRRETPARRTGNHRLSRDTGSKKLRVPNAEVVDMSPQNDGTYGLQPRARTNSYVRGKKFS